MTNTKGRVLIVDDSAEMARSLCDGLADRGFSADPASSGAVAIQRLERESFDAVVTDLRMPDVDGFAVLAASQQSNKQRPVIVMTAFSAIESAIESIRRGAYHYLTKPFRTEELAIFLERGLSESKVRRVASALQHELRRRFAAAAIVGASAPVSHLRDMIARLADAPAPVLILGETGAGKGVVARALHADGARAEGPFVAVNCASLPEALLESELFGHAKGAFTGATSARDGLFLEADGGTLFLDEIGEMTPALQAKLLHVLEHATIRPVGANRERRIDVRVLAATNRDLRADVRTGKFRADLLYRLDVVSLTVPALRERRDDIPMLVAHFLGEARSRYPRATVERFADDTLDVLRGYEWPGNVRELAHLVERVVLLGHHPEVLPSDLPDALRPPATSGADDWFRGEIMPIRELQRRYAAWALDQMGGHRGRTAERLGIDAKTLWNWLQSSQGRNEP